MKIFILLLGVIALASNSVECCSTSSGGTSGGGGGGGGGVIWTNRDVVHGPRTLEQQLACDIGDHNNIKLLKNNGVFPRIDGNTYNENDGADAYSNINDTCKGRKAKRSTGPCPPGETTLGGYVSLKASVLSYILKVANEGDYGDLLQINVIAGECHSSNQSWHLDGRSVDIQIKRNEPDYYYLSWRRICLELGGQQDLGPGDTGHSTHTHCGFAS